MGSCAAPSAKGDDKFITTDYLQQCPGRDSQASVRVLSPVDLNKQIGSDGATWLDRRLIHGETAD
ncbi:DUF3363 domain-containing protein, partial [Salmonella enterica]|uniref:DUF3363 domain-containing protein n=1 Tax=Salmonella enterica TaxID=28901 RepID=UPI001C12B5BB